MDVRYINPVLETIVKVLSTMADMHPQMGTPRLKTDELALGEVSGIMSLNSHSLRGSLAISFSQPVIVDIVNRMLGEEIEDMEATTRDMAGEMTNMVVGGAKNIFAEKGYDFEMSIPDILSGKDHRIHHGLKSQTVLLPFQADSGEFFVEICFEDMP
jgi:chemotaxis protein CheX